MKHHFLLPCIALLFSVAACSGSDEGDGNAGGAPSGGATAGTSGSVGGTAGSGSSSGGSNAAGTSSAAGTPGASGSGAGGSSAGAGQGGSSSGGAGAGAGGTTTGGAGGAGGSGGSGGGQAGSGGAGGGAAMTGEALYTSKCAACHGAQGVGGTLGPEIQHPVRDYSAWVVRHGRAQTTFPAPMIAVTTMELSDAALNSIWDYLDAPPQPTTGPALYKDYCANCHGADGKGGPTMRNILNELGALKTTVRQGAHAGQFDMRREYMPAFGMDVISNAELDLIYAYVDSL